MSSAAAYPLSLTPWPSRFATHSAFGATLFTPFTNSPTRCLSQTSMMGKLIVPILTGFFGYRATHFLVAAAPIANDVSASLRLMNGVTFSVGRMERGNTGIPAAWASLMAALMAPASRGWMMIPSTCCAIRSSIALACTSELDLPSIEMTFMPNFLANSASQFARACW